MDQLLARFCAVINPVDIIEEMFLADVVSLEWEVLRGRRLKTSLIRARGLEALERFLARELDYDLYSEHFADLLAHTLRNELPKAEAQTLARECARSEPDAVEKVNKILAGMNLDMDNVLNRASAAKAKELVQAYARRDPDAVTLVEELLAEDNMSMDTLVADALVKDLDHIERIDRLTTIAESRRNISLREIEGRRAVLGQALRRSVREIEDGEFEEIEPKPVRGKNAA
jgi:hypothetical protein